MSDLDRIVSVNISREGKTVTQKGFGSALVLADVSEKPVAMTSRTRVYSSLSAVLADFAETTEVYKAALAYFSPAIKPEELLVGFIEGVETIAEAIEAIKIENPAFYAIGLTSMVKQDQLDLAAHIEADCRLVALRSDDDNILTVNNDVLTTEIVRLINSANPDAGGYDFVIDGESANINQGFSNAQIKDALEALPSIAVGSTNVTGEFGTNDLSVEFLNAAQFGAVITLDNVTLTESSNPVTLNITTDQVGTTENDDIAKALNDLNRTRSFVIYNSNAVSQYPDFAWLGRVLPTGVGSSTWKFKTLNGVVVDTFSDNERTVLASKKCNFYNEFGGVDITEEGTVASGDFIDNIISVDFIKSRMQESIYQTLVSVDKIPFTNAGVDLIVNKMEAVLKNAVDAGILSSNPYPVVTKPDVRDISFNDRSVRCLPDIGFTGVLAGGVHRVKIDGNVTV